MKLYALGALNLFGSLYDIKAVRMHIFQPRLENISISEISVDELTEWAETELKEKAGLAIKGEGKFLPGEHCRFCKARHKCRARAESFLEMAKYDFKPPHLLSDMNGRASREGSIVIPMGERHLGLRDGSSDQ